IKMIPAQILGTGSLTAGVTISSAELVARGELDRDPAEVERRTGIRTRHWLEPERTAAGLAAGALRKALEAAGCTAPDLRRIIFVSSTGGDWLLPATVNGLFAELGLDDTCDGFDLANSCAGFLSAFDVAARSVATGISPVAVVVAETFSRYVS